MKKTSKVMRIACALAIATAMSTCVVAGTLAKYTTSGSSSDTARVAKWGVKVEATGNAFATEYKNGEAVTVKSSGADKVIAPGTTGKFGGTSISGTPEVKVHVVNSGSVTLSDGWTDSGGAYYCPITFKIGDQTYTVTKADDLSTINSALSGSYDKDAGATLSGGVPEVTWEWAFDDAQKTGSNDTKDTALGNKGTAPTVTISASTTVTQID